jgi:hypothetical protein
MTRSDSGTADSSLFDNSFASGMDGYSAYIDYFLGGSIVIY